ncbi:polyketide cyclase [Mycobacterium sp. E136]|uniref:nuclear transport factor 2 family protein n=1 Tax=Mycobacterium sp. E136 TaxID=1834125 RepID=UPI0007FD23EF|nr:nuclear transport factor 2 family protein [Mycobacterium sp. E136]OBG92962.1 polyketide cyclase [Mycobacterium sp. E136]
MSTSIDIARRFYGALAGADGPALFRLLTDDFVGTVSAGMPHGVGGRHRGPADMIAGVWGRIGTLYDMHVDPAEYLAVDDDRVVVIGRYWGPARDGRTTVDAAFAHVITTREDQIAALHQITDTARWNIPVP